jgi:hypothetical protein
VDKIFEMMGFPKDNEDDSEEKKLIYQSSGLSSSTIGLSSSGIFRGDIFVGTDGNIVYPTDRGSVIYENKG